MVYSGQIAAGATDSRVASPSAEIDTITLSDLAGDSGWRRPALLRHHLLILVTGGQGSAEVDFRRLPCRPGTLLRTRPGQALRCSLPPALETTVVRWTGEALASVGRAATGAATHWQLAGEDQDAVINEISQLGVDCQRHRHDELGRHLLRHQLAVLLLRLALLPGSEPTAPAGELGTYHRLNAELERSYRHTRRVEDYAGQLRCSVRTLTRACLAATGRSAKQVIDERVALQARRLLAATDEPIAEIGRRLGFPEPTNFGRFFAREVGQTPGAFRTAYARPVTAPSIRISTPRLPADPSG